MILYELNDARLRGGETDGPLRRHADALGASRASLRPGVGPPLPGVLWDPDVGRSLSGDVLGSTPPH